VFGLYVIAFGHLSPGGGFQGGVVLGIAVLLIMITLGKDKIKSLALQWTFIETLAVASLIFIGIMGFVFGEAFLSNVLPKGVLRLLPSGGTIPLLNMVIGLKVFAGIVILYLSLLEWGYKR
jgi:multicomponent Na+:H+ antiporter subunit B